MPPKLKLEKAAFAAGCFWGIQKAFDETKGVVNTTVGYMGGWKKNPSYVLVCTGMTGHAETVFVEFDPKKVSYEKLLELFWKIHDPTQMNRQGPDIGTQYRSAIFYYSKEQKDQAFKSKEKEQKKLGKNKIATEIVPASEFFKAEEYHQKYYKTHPGVC